MKNKFYTYALLTVCCLFLLKSDNAKFKRVSVTPKPSAHDIINSCDPLVIIPIGQLRITGATFWILTHSKFCLGHRDVVSIVSMGGDPSVDSPLSRALVQGYIKSLRDEKSLLCSTEIESVNSASEDSDGVTSTVYPYILSCKNFE